MQLRTNDGGHVVNGSQHLLSLYIVVVYSVVNFKLAIND